MVQSPSSFLQLPFALLSLRLLGGVALSGSGGPITGRAAHKRRLGLLARLALAPQRTLSRDKLIGVLWPESDDEQARHLLSQSLHELRRALGEDTLQTRGDDVVLNPNLVAVDVDEFRGAVERGDTEAAIGLYTGPLMDGFFANDAPELERWIEVERSQLARQYAQMLEQSARTRAAVGDQVASVEAWRRVAALDPLNARIACELIMALDASGNRAGALQHARVHAALLQEEFGAQPDPAITALVERLRNAPGTLTPIVVAKATTRAVEPPAETAPVSTPATVTQARAELVRRPERKAVRLFPGRRRFKAITFGVLIGAGLFGVPQLISFFRPAGVVSVAVLPFRNMTPLDTLQYFGDGLAEEIIGALGKLRGLRVTALTSSFLLRDSVAVAEVGRRLNVRYVLEGSVRGAGGRVKVGTRLYDARTGENIWGDDYDRAWSMDSIISMQEQIARAVVGQVAAELVPDSAGEVIMPAPTRSMQAFQNYLSGRPFFRMRSPAALQTALALFKQAVALDPDYALAHAGIADTYAILAAYDYGVLAPVDAFRESRQAAERALGLAPSLAQAHAALGNVYYNYDREWVAAEREFTQAISLNPGYAPAYHWYSILLAARGRMKEAGDAIQNALEIDPLSQVIGAAYGRHLYFARENQAALEQFRTVISQDPTFVPAHAGIGLVLVALQQYDSAIAYYREGARIAGGPTPLLRGLLAHALGLAGRTDEARAELAELTQQARARYLPSEYLVLAYMGLRDYTRATESLETVFRVRSGGIVFLKVEPLLDPLRNDPRFQQLVLRSGL